MSCDHIEKKTAILSSRYRANWSYQESNILNLLM